MLSAAVYFSSQGSHELATYMHGSFTCTLTVREVVVGLEYSAEGETISLYRGERRSITYLRDDKTDNRLEASRPRGGLTTSVPGPVSMTQL